MSEPGGTATPAAVALAELPEGAPAGTGSRTRKRPLGAHGAATRDRILRAAAEELAARGDIAVVAVARRARVSRQTVHQHFRGRDGLAAALRAAGTPVPEDATARVRERLVDAAIEVLSGQTSRRQTIEGIAAAAGVTKGAVYYHFGDKSGLLREIAARISPAAELQAAIDATEGQSDRQRLVAFVRAYDAALLARSGFIRGFAAFGLDDPELGGVLARELVGSVVRVPLDWLSSRMEAGALRRVDPSFALQLLLGPIAARAFIGPQLAVLLPQVGFIPAIERVEDWVDLVLDGLGADRSDSSGA